MEGKNNKTISLKKSLPRLYIMVAVIFLILVLFINTNYQIYSEHQSQKQSSIEVFGQLEQLIETNKGNLESEKIDFKNRCIRAANVVAHFIARNKSMIDNSEELRSLAKLLSIDEINFFDDKGLLYAGTHDEYFGLSMYSGVQMNFFEPMLRDKELKLCQDIVPNTANNKEMQYAAVWLEDGSSIVQIGLEPIRILNEIEENSFKNILANLPFKMKSKLHIISRDDFTILASTNVDVIGMKLTNNHIKYTNNHDTDLFHSEFDGRKYCVYTHSYDDYIFVRTYESAHIMDSMQRSGMMIALYYILGGFGILLAIRWYIKKYITNNVDEINKQVSKIDSGDMNNIVLKTNVSEFDELLSYVNHMLNNIRLNWNKLDYIMDKGGIPIGIFEKNIFYKKVFINERILEILGIHGAQNLSIEEKAEIIEMQINKALQNEVDSSEHIYRFVKDDKVKYLRIENMEDQQSFVYYVTDLTMWWVELNQIKEQSIIDELTKLYNRRGFHEKMNKYFENLDYNSYGAMVMIDADNLKRINDFAGHYTGDEYLKNIANTLVEVVGSNSICARLGGDEFVIFLYGYDNINELDKRIDSIRKIRGTHFDHLKGEVVSTLQFSIGVSYFPLDGKDFHVLMRIADESMYQEKRNRKKFNRGELYF